MPENMFVPQFVGFTVEVTCKFCGEKIAIPNSTTKSDMDKLIVAFRRAHDKAHQEAA